MKGTVIKTKDKTQIAYQEYDNELGYELTQFVDVHEANVFALKERNTVNFFITIFENGDRYAIIQPDDKVSVNYGWATDGGGNWIKNYPDINEDENVFDTREEAIEWLNIQKRRDDDFGDSECFILKEMFFV